MDSVSRLIFTIALAGLMCLGDLSRVLKTGKAHLWPGGVATRKGQPRRYWRYVYSSVFFATACLGVLTWVMIDPVTFQ